MLKNKDLIKKKAYNFIAEKDEFAEIIQDGMIDQGQDFLYEFVNYLYELGMVDFNSQK